MTGTFAHGAGNVLDLHVEGLAEPIGCTANHPFWSETRQAFVPAGELLQGETLRTASGELRPVASLVPRPTPQPVYNLEVDAHHVYHVSDAGVLVHNACPGMPRGKGPSAKRSTFPKDPADLLPEIPRTPKGFVQASDRIRIRPEQHAIKPGETFAPRHHGQHYHVEIRIDPSKSWNNPNNVIKVKPPGYTPGEGTGFLPGELFPGM